MRRKVDGETKPKEDRIYDALVRGFSREEVADQFQTTVDEIDALCQSRLDTLRARIADGLALATVMEVERMDIMIRVLMPAVEQGDGPAIDRVLNIGKQRRALLGLDAPAVKASLSLGAGQVDLSLLSSEELAVLERIQDRLKAPPKDVRDITVGRKLRAPRSKPVDLPTSGEPGDL